MSTIKGKHLKIDEKLLDQVKKIAEKKFPLWIGDRDFYSVSVKAVLIDFVNKNQKYLNDNEDTKQTSINNQEKVIET